MRGLGTLINTVTVLGGGVLGLVIGNRIPDRIRKIIVQVIGLTTLVIGLRDVIDTKNIVFPLVGMVLGGILGELLRIEDRLANVGELLRRRFAKQSSESSFVNGFVTATLLFCVGPLTILGAIEDASGKTPQLYIIKGTLDGFMTIIFTAVYGVGAIFSAISVFVVQGSLTTFGTSLDSLLSDRMRLELFSAGGLAVIAIGINLLEIKKIRLGSLLPGLVITPLLVRIFATPNGLIHLL
ncbi:MAG: DUF554 domain-containing protein [Actinobacteria bacterium]|nr:DUF554 domain-containing protein [Actinomycetota bacterium]